jgi:GH24 family phage-related lysozyme (muramidase)
MASISKAGLSLIKEFEGCRLTSYTCAAGVLTIGYGSTGPHVTPGKTITQAEADALLLKDVARFEKGVDDLITVPLKQCQFDALVSFAFNCGNGALEESTLRKRLNAGEDPNTVAKEELPRWTNKGLAGLVRRRTAEVNMFCSGGGAATAAKTTDLTATNNTLLKKEPVPSSELEDNEKSEIDKGKAFKGAKVLATQDNHTQVELPYGLGTWWLFDGHWAELDGKEDKPEPAGDGSVNLAVPYFNQVDNYTQAQRTCNSSSCAMCLAFLMPGKIKGDDDYLRKLLTGGYGDTTDHGAQGRLLASYGLKSTWHTNLGFDDLEKEIKAGRPVVIGILHRGSLAAPTGGHMLVVRGMTAKGDFIVNDPYGSVNDGYSGPVTNGNQAVYSRAMLQKRWLPEGAKSGWGRKFQP